MSELGDRPITPRTFCPKLMGIHFSSLDFNIAFIDMASKGRINIDLIPQ